MVGQHRASTALPPRERPGSRSTGGWVGFRVGIGVSAPGFDRRTVHSVEIRCTSDAVPIALHVINEAIH